jgi:prevent-host-death family protein
MIVVNIHEAKAKLSEYLDAVARGERVLICKRNQPVAELRAVEQSRTAPRTIGGVAGIVVPASFFEPMPRVLDAFESGRVSDAGRVEATARRRSRATYTASGSGRGEGAARHVHVHLGAERRAATVAPRGGHVPSR